MHALTRQPSPAFARCQLSHLERQPIDLERARQQHAAYGELLAQLGCTVAELPGEARFPDCVFVEDTAVVVDELAVIARPGAPSRRGETEAVAAALTGLRPLARITAPGTLDGGDVLRLGRRVFVGRSARTDRQGRAQLRALLEPHGYQVTGVDLRGCLHLKSAVTAVGDETLLVHPPWVDTSPFAGCELLPVDPSEPFAANALRVGEAVVLPAAFARTRERLERRGLEVHPLAVDELAKAEGGVTCCSLLVASPGD
ncbi:MAG TPA: dimethylargininase [Thermoanaerobaculia bacterium]|nr:dimethylargininase [Thermoanaerobaculia bacterium]